MDDGPLTTKIGWIEHDGGLVLPVSAHGDHLYEYACAICRCGDQPLAAAAFVAFFEGELEARTSALRDENETLTMELNAAKAQIGVRDRVLEAQQSDAVRLRAALAGLVTALDKRESSPFIQPTMIEAMRNARIALASGDPERNEGR